MLSKDFLVLAQLDILLISGMPLLVLPECFERIIQAVLPLIARRIIIALLALNYNAKS